MFLGSRHRAWGSIKVMLCIICEKEFPDNEKPDELYAHAEGEHGLSRVDYDKIDNYVLDGDGEQREKTSEISETRPDDYEASLTLAPPLLYCIVCEAEFVKDHEEKFWMHVVADHGLSQEEYKKMDNLMERDDGEDVGRKSAQKGKQEQGKYVRIQESSLILYCF